MQAGLNRFLEKMFPKGGPAEGYLKLAQSFFKAAFHAATIDCAKVGVATLSRLAQARGGTEKTLRDAIASLDSLIARAQQELAALAEQDA